MFTTFLLIVVLAALAVLGTWFWGSIFGRGEIMEPLDDPKTVTDDNIKAVDEGRIDDVTFELVPRGYRPEQVDAVLAELAKRTMDSGH